MSSECSLGKQFFVVFVGFWRSSKSKENLQLIKLHTSNPSNPAATFWFCFLHLFCFFTQILRHIQNLATSMWSVSWHAALSAVAVIGMALPGSNAKCLPLSENGNAEQMLCCRFRLSASVFDGPAFSQSVCLRLEMGSCLVRRSEYLMCHCLVGLSQTD